MQKSVRHDTKDKPGQLNIFVSSWTKNNLSNFTTQGREPQKVLLMEFESETSVSVNKDRVKMTEN